MSHEIRTPLNGIIGLSEIILESDDGQKNRERTRTILGESTHLLDLVNELLDHAKIESGKLELELRPIDLHELMRTVTFFILYYVSQ